MDAERPRGYAQLPHLRCGLPTIGAHLITIVHPARSLILVVVAEISRLLSVVPSYRLTDTMKVRILAACFDSPFG